MRPFFSPAFLLFPLLWMARRRSRGYFVPRTPADWPILGLLSMTLVSTLVTPDLLGSLDKISGLVYAIVLFYAFVDWGQGQPSLLALALVLVALAGGTALLSFFGLQVSAEWAVLKPITSRLPQVISGLPGAELGFNPNAVSSTLITFIPLQLALLWGLLSSASLQGSKRRWIALGVGLLLSLTGFIVLLAQTRAAWAAVVFGVTGVAALAARRFRFFFVALIAVGLIVLVVVGPVGVTEWFFQQGLTVGVGEASWVARIERWSRWLWAIAEYPLTGIGMDVFRWLGWEMYPFFQAPFGADLGHAHNTFLHIALDLGLPGLVFYLALLGGALAAGYWSYRHSSDRLTRLITAGGLMGLATHLLWSFVDVLPLGARTNFLWWTVVALVVTGAIRENRSIKPVQDPPQAATQEF
jgi:O-antigen ligase